MSPLPAHLPPETARSLAFWHDLVARRDFGPLEQIIHPQAVFRSPVSIHPYGPAPALLLALRTVITIFEDFTYHRQLASDDGLSVVLEFSARVGDKQLKGIDLIRFDASGLIVDFEVMIRPLNGLQALAAEMGARLAQAMPGYKIKG
ncbi:MAG: nuclear transport factor 2 family protein [Burkholderiaceae bacterium]